MEGMHTKKGADDRLQGEGQHYGQRGQPLEHRVEPRVAHHPRPRSQIPHQAYVGGRGPPQQAVIRQAPQPAAEGRQAGS